MYRVGKNLWWGRSSAVAILSQPKWTGLNPIQKQTLFHAGFILWQRIPGFSTLPYYKQLAQEFTSFKNQGTCCGLGPHEVIFMKTSWKKTTPTHHYRKGKDMNNIFSKIPPTVFVTKPSIAVEPVWNNCCVMEVNYYTLKDIKTKKLSTSAHS